MDHDPRSAEGRCTKGQFAGSADDRNDINIMESGKPSSIRSRINHQGARDMRLSLRIELAQWIIIAAMFVAASVVWPTAPDQLPVHWSIQGQADGFGGKFEGLLLLPLVTLGIYLLLAFLPRFDPRAGNYAR